MKHRSPGLRTTMSTLLVSSKGQIVLPAALRRRLGMGAGARIEVLEESDGLKLRVVRSVATTHMTALAGMVKAPTRGVPRRLEDFDPASLLTRSRSGKSSGRWIQTSWPGSSSMMPMMHRPPTSGPPLSQRCLNALSYR